MNELKPEDVMKALECCAGTFLCDECPRKKDEYRCVKNLVKDAHALLREKDAAHKELWEERMRIYQDLQEYKAECKKLLEEFNKLIAEKDAEIERLKAYIQRCKSGEEYWVKCLLERPQEAQAEAITEFEERLKGFIVQNICVVDDSTDSIYKAITQIAKEMKGETDGKTDL